jgi:diguanylate cyclase (GGDEF)-like protein
MNQDLMNRILRCPSLPSLPAVAVKVIDLTSKPDVSLDELARVIQNDQALAAKILRTVNSSFYGLRRPCANISQSLVMLGLSTVKSLALSFSLVASLGSGSGEKFDYIAYWRRGLYTAVAARCLARAAGVLHEDEAFLGGLLQDIGMVAMYRALGARYAALIAEGTHGDLAQRELHSLELQHPDVGAMLAQRWRLPTELIVPVRYHERPTAAPREHADLVRCVAVGNTAHDVLTDADPTESLRRFQGRCREWFSLDSTIADDLLRKIAEATRQTAPLFQIDTGRPSDAEAILSRAHAQLESIRENTEPVASMNRLLADSELNDPLTGLLQASALLARAEEKARAARASGQSLAAVHITIDAFPAVAATGAEPADAVVVESATLMGAHLAPTGAIVSHAGNGEFIAVLPGAAPEDAFHRAESFRAALKTASPGWSLPASIRMPLSASAGVAIFTPARPASIGSVRQLLLAAKAAAEAAQREGGDRVRSSLPRAAAA